jgi:hypothetical protein
MEDAEQSHHRHQKIQIANTIADVTDQYVLQQNVHELRPLATAVRIDLELDTRLSLPSEFPSLQLSVGSHHDNFFISPENSFKAMAFVKSSWQ